MNTPNKQAEIEKEIERIMENATQKDWIETMNGIINIASKTSIGKMDSMQKMTYMIILQAELKGLKEGEKSTQKHFKDFFNELTNILLDDENISSEHYILLMRKFNELKSKLGVAG